MTQKAKKMLAIAPIGAEFFYRASSAHTVPTASAKKIADLLNTKGWGLKDGETWHVYDCGWYEMANTAAGWQKFSIRNGCLCEGKC